TMVAPTTLPTVWWSLALPLRFPAPRSSPGAPASSGVRTDIRGQPRECGVNGRARPGPPRTYGVGQNCDQQVAVGPIRRRSRAGEPERRDCTDASHRLGPGPARLPDRRRLLVRGAGLVVGRGAPGAVDPDAERVEHRDGLHPVEHLPPHLESLVACG